MALRTVPIHTSGIRHNLFMGCDRELILSSIILCAAVSVGTVNPKAIAFSLVFLVFAFSMLRKLGKYDPLIRKIYLKDRAYKRYYPARSGAFAVSRRQFK